MEIFLDYLKVFAVGGALCALGQLLINKTQMSSARILVTFMLLGVVLELAGAFSYMKEFASAGVTIPITGFGSGLARGALRGAKEGGLLGAISGGLEAVAPGIAAVIFSVSCSPSSSSRTAKSYDAARGVHACRAPFRACFCAQPL